MALTNNERIAKGLELLRDGLGSQVRLDLGWILRGELARKPVAALSPPTGSR